MQYVLEESLLTLEEENYYRGILPVLSTQKNNLLKLLTTNVLKHELKFIT